MSGSALETSDLCKSFGALKVVDNISLRLAQGARHALIGPNGAGKTTLVQLLSGVLRPDAGKILLKGEDRRLVFQAVHMILEGDFQGEWKPGAPRESRMVFIGRNLDEDELKRGFEACAA